MTLNYRRGGVQNPFRRDRRSNDIMTSRWCNVLCLTVLGAFVWVKSNGGGFTSNNFKPSARPTLLEMELGIDSKSVDARRKFNTIPLDRMVNAGGQQKRYQDHLQEMATALEKTLSVSRVSSCYIEDCEQHIRHQVDGIQPRLVFFNPLEAERILCDGSRMAPRSLKILQGNDETLCTEPPRLFVDVPSVQNKQDMDPVEVKSDAHSHPAPFPCDVPCISDEPNGLFVQKSSQRDPLEDILVHGRT